MPIEKLKLPNHVTWYSLLDKRKAMILLARECGVSRDEIGKKLFITGSRVWQLEREARQEVQKFIEQEELGERILRMTKQERAALTQEEIEDLISRLGVEAA